MKKSWLSDETISDPKVSIYKNVRDTEGKPASLSVTMNAIKNGKRKDRITKLCSILSKDEQKRFKNTLPCFRRLMFSQNVIVPESFSKESKR